MFSSRIACQTLRTFLAAVVFASVPTISPGEVRAQALPIEPGDEVRIRWSYDGSSSFAHTVTQVAIAEVVDVSPSHVMLRRGGRNFTVPMGTVQSLERRIGTKPASAPRMVIGSGLGFLGGVAFGIISAQADPTIENASDYGLSMGVLLGAPVGALVAWATSRERGIYERVGVRQLVSGWTVDPTGRVGLTVRLPGG